MKRFICTVLVFSALLNLFAKSKLTIKNTVGADLDELGDYDLVTHTQTESIDGSTDTDTAFALGDQFQIEWESSQLNARFRLETLYTNADDAEAKLLFVPAGFVHYAPDVLHGLGFAAGNNFFKYFAIPAAYLAADDTTTKYGRLLTDSLGADHYFGSDTLALYSNGFAGGVTGDWQLGSDSLGFLKLAAGATVYPDGSDTEKAVDVGINAGVKNLFDVGFTAHNLTEDDRKFGAFAGYTADPDLVLNLGFYYNFTDSDYLSESRVTRSDDDTGEDIYKYKKQSTKYALGLSGGYHFRRTGWGVYADTITGLTNEYIGEIKYYDSNGNLIKTETTTIVRGGTIVKYKNGKAKRTDEYPHEGIPFYSQLRVTYDFTDSVQAACNVKFRTLLHASDDTWLTFYPRVSFDVPQIAGSIKTGIRLDMNLTRYDGISSFSFPLSYTYKFKRKYK